VRIMKSCACLAVVTSVVVLQLAAIVWGVSQFFGGLDYGESLAATGAAVALIAAALMFLLQPWDLRDRQMAAETVAIYVAAVGVALLPFL